MWHLGKTKRLGASNAHFTNAPKQAPPLGQLPRGGRNAADPNETGRSGQTESLRVHLSTEEFATWLMIAFSRRETVSLIGTDVDWVKATRLSSVGRSSFGVLPVSRKEAHPWLVTS
jgi:hypothetical protein